jgi:4-hydroxythreonine-4-phosphate dehydrogenase
MIAITMGDPAGVGPEIIAKFFAARPGVPAFVIGDAGVMARAAKMAAPGVTIRQIAAPEGLVPQAGVIPVLVPGAENTSNSLESVATNGRLSFNYVTTAIDLALEGRIAAMVTAPIAKDALAAAGIAFPGHTEILAERTGTTRFGMMLANNDLRVVLVSIHVSLAEALRLVTTENVIRAIRLAEEGTRAFGIARPRIAVAGLNPHAGEGGLFGREEIEIIAPAVAAMQAEGLEVSGPYPPDTVFMRARAGAFDVVVAQYHDQGLIPVKYLGIEEGVNITIGLPIIRTSVDHGTAFDIAWQGKASAASLMAAYDAAVRLVEARAGLFRAAH